MEDKGKLGMLIVAFLIIVLGAVFADVLADQNWLHRNTYTVTNETVTGSDSTAVDLDNDHLVSITSVTNQSDTLQTLVATNYSATVQRLYNGEFILLTDTYDGDVLNITYVYNPSGYVRDSTARVLLNLIPLFFVIAVLLFIAIPVLKRLDWI